LKFLTKSKERIMTCLVIVIVAVFMIISPDFRSVNTLFNMIRAIEITAIMAIPCLLVFICGGIDLSFMSIASFSMYASVMFFNTLGGELPIILMFLFGIAVGVGLGLVNAFFVNVTKMPIFIVTLATQFIFMGACLAFIGTSYLQVPANMVSLSQTNLISTVDANGNQISINISILIVVALYIIIALVLKYTKFGRAMYAIGGDTDAARRAGINVTKTMTLMFALFGAICAIGGVLNGTLLRLAVPGDMVGGELTVIAACILGGADSVMGKGSVYGTFIGVVLITVISNSLNLLGIPSFWQEAVIGAVVIGGTIFSVVFNNRNNSVRALKRRAS